MSELNQSSAAPEPALIGLMKENTRFGPEKPRTTTERLNHSFDHLVEHSGLEVTPALALAVVALIGVSLGGAMFVWQESLLSAGVGLVAGAGFSVVFLRLLRDWRFSQIRKQLPEAIDVMARAVRAGRSLEQSIEEVSREVPAPLGSEFKRLSLRLGLGMSVGQAVRELPRRLPFAGMHIFATALTIHERVGGNLTQALDQLAQTIRERAEFQGKFRAATAGARFSVIFLLAVGPAVLLFESLRDPTYLATLMSEPVGRGILLTAFSLQVVGSAWIMGLFRSGMSDAEL